MSLSQGLDKVPILCMAPAGIKLRWVGTATGQEEDIYQAVGGRADALFWFMGFLYHNTRWNLMQLF